MTARLVLSLLILSLFCRGEEPKKAVSSKAPTPLTYESLRAWHKAGGIDGYTWPKEHKLDLNDDGKAEIFLGTAGFGRGMSYALFSQTKKGWILLCDDVTASHHEPERLPRKHDGWHDFSTLHPTGRGGLWEVIYTWDGKAYVEKSRREITEKSCFLNVSKRK